MKNKKKIFYIWKSAYPWDVRIEKICKTLFNQGYEPYVICKWEGENSEIEKIDGINIIRVGFNQNSKKYIPLPFNPYWKVEIEKLIIKYKPDLIFNREIILADISGKLAKKYNIPIIMDMAENYPAVIKNWKKYTNNIVKRLIFKKSNLVYKLEEKTTSLMDGIIVVCQENKQRLIDKYNLDSDKIEIIYNTPSKRFFNFKRFEDKREYKTIAYHGYINNERNLEEFLDVAKEFKDYDFHLWGKVTSDSQIELVFKNHDNIKFFGEYNLANLKEIIKQTDIGILPYVNDEHINNTISNKFFDYMANGIPVLCSNAKPMVELIDEISCGSYYNLSSEENIRDALTKLKNNNLDEMGKNGYDAFTNKYNWEEDEKKLIGFLESFIK